MNQYTTTDNKIFTGERALCIYLVQIHHEACHEADFDRIAALCLRFGIVKSEVPPPPALTAEQIAANKKALIAAIANAAREAVESEANAALQDQMWANYKSATPHLYVVENINWGKAIYSAAENRKAQVEAGVADDYVTLCDFSSFGPKPYTVYQLYVAGVVEI